MQNEFPEVKTMSLLNLCRYLDRGRLTSVIEKAIQDRLGDAWGLFEQLRLNHLEWNPESKSAAETALARLAGEAVSMLSGDNDHTGRNTVKAMRTLKLCLDVLPGEAAESRAEVILTSDPDPLRAAAARSGQQLAKPAVEVARHEDGSMRGTIARLTPMACEQNAFATKNLGAGISWPTIDFSGEVVERLTGPLEDLTAHMDACADFLANKHRLATQIVECSVAELVAGFMAGWLGKKAGGQPDDALRVVVGKLAAAKFGPQLRDRPSDGESKSVFCCPFWGDAESHQNGCPSLIQKDKDAMRELFPGKQTLIELCREFDAIDLSECNRRLEAGEKFNAACDKAMEKRIALADQLKTRLGDDWVTFEAYAEVSDPKDSAEAALWELATAIASRLSGHVAEQDIELVKPQLSRLVELFTKERP